MIELGLLKQHQHEWNEALQAGSVRNLLQRQIPFLQMVYLPV